MEVTYSWLSGPERLDPVRRHHHLRARSRCVTGEAGQLGTVSGRLRSVSMISANGQMRSAFEQRPFFIHFAETCNMDVDFGVQAIKLLCRACEV
jgi:hypothetical protein